MQMLAAGQQQGEPVEAPDPEMLQDIMRHFGVQLPVEGGGAPLDPQRVAALRAGAPPPPLQQALGLAQRMVAQRQDPSASIEIPGLGLAPHKGELFLNLFKTFSELFKKVQSHLLRNRSRSSSRLPSKKVEGRLYEVLFMVLTHTLVSDPMNPLGGDDEIPPECDESIRAQSTDLSELLDEIGLRGGKEVTAAKRALSAYIDVALSKGALVSRSAKSISTEKPEWGLVLAHLKEHASTLKFIAGLYEYELKKFQERGEGCEVDEFVRELIAALHEAAPLMESLASQFSSRGKIPLESAWAFLVGMRKIHELLFEQQGKYHTCCVEVNRLLQEGKESPVIILSHTAGFLSAHLTPWLRSIYFHAAGWLYREAVDRKAVSFKLVRKVSKRISKHLPVWEGLQQQIGSYRQHPDPRVSALAGYNSMQIDIVVDLLKALKSTDQDWQPMVRLVIFQVLSFDAWNQLNEAIKDQSFPTPLLEALRQFYALQSTTLSVIDDATFGQLERAGEWLQGKLVEELEALDPEPVTQPETGYSAADWIPLRGPSPVEEKVEEEIPTVAEPPPVPLRQLVSNLAGPAHHGDIAKAAKTELINSLAQLEVLCGVAREEAWNMHRAKLALDRVRLLLQSALDFALIELDIRIGSEPAIEATVGGHPLHHEHDLALLAAPIRAAGLGEPWSEIASHPLIQKLRKANSVLWYASTGRALRTTDFGKEWFAAMRSLMSPEPQEQALAVHWLEKEIIEPSELWLRSLLDALSAGSEKGKVVDGGVLKDLTSEEGTGAPQVTKAAQSAFNSSLSSKLEADSVERVMDKESALRALKFMTAVLDLAQLQSLTGKRRAGHARWEKKMRDEFIVNAEERLRELRFAMNDRSLLEKTPRGWLDVLVLATRLLSDVYRASLFHLPLYCKGVHVMFVKTNEPEVKERTSLLKTNDLSLLSRVLTKPTSYLEGRTLPALQITPLTQPYFSRLRSLLSHPIPLKGKGTGKYQRVLDLVTHANRLSELAAASEGSALAQMQEKAEPILFEIIGAAQEAIQKAWGTLQS